MSRNFRLVYALALSVGLLVGVSDMRLAAQGTTGTDIRHGDGCVRRGGSGSHGDLNEHRHQCDADSNERCTRTIPSAGSARGSIPDRDEEKRF